MLEFLRAWIIRRDGEKIVNCCGQCDGIEKEFNADVARRELVRYRRRGVGGTTHVLVEALKHAGVKGATLLDIGGGVGIIQHELVRAGASRVTSVDASPAYVETQRDEAARQGYADRAIHVRGDFIAVADRLPENDVVTLDRVICCYPDMRSLVALSVARARRLYGVVYPRGIWWNVLGFRLINFVLRLRRSSFRAYLHPPHEIDTLIRSRHFRPSFARQTLIWHVVVYTRSTP